jgi:hypothetical protein
MMGKAFEKYFESIDLVPHLKDDDKTIYFQKADKLTTINKEQKQQLCIALGYFFTRLFQIFAAIYFTIFDDDSIKPGQTQNLYGVLPFQQQETAVLLTEIGLADVDPLLVEEQQQAQLL